MIPLLVFLGFGLYALWRWPIGMGALILFGPRLVGAIFVTFLFILTVTQCHEGAGGQNQEERVRH